MRKIFLIMFGAFLLMSLSGLSYAQEARGMMNGMGMGMQSSGGMMGCKMMMGKEMMGSLMSKSMVATGDGGIVVMAGDRLLKYDEDLNLKKEVKIEMDMDGMVQRMSEMYKKCPMREMMKRGDTTEGHQSNKPTWLRKFQGGN